MYLLLATQAAVMTCQKKSIHFLFWFSVVKSCFVDVAIDKRNIPLRLPQLIGDANRLLVGR